MPTLTLGQYDLVYNALSFTIATMGAAFVFFLLARNTVAYKYQRVMVIAAIIVGIAAYHYVRMFASWNAAFAHSGTTYTATNELFNEAYRYADWLLTVPLLLVELIAVLSIAGAHRSGLILRLVVAAALMIGLGYPGEVSADTTTRLIWGTLSTIPFVYILYVLWSEVGTAMNSESPQVRVLLRKPAVAAVGKLGRLPDCVSVAAAQLRPSICIGCSPSELLGCRCGCEASLWPSTVRNCPHQDPGAASRSTSGNAGGGAVA